MNCKEICELLTAYLDGEVTPEEKGYVEAHLPGCPQCRAELETLSATQSSLRGVLKSMADEVSPPTQAWDRVRARLDTKGSWFDGLHRLLTSRTWQVATVTAAVVVIAVVATIWQFGGVGQVPVPAPAPASAPAPAPTPAPRPAPPSPFQRSVVPEEAYYLPGEIVEVKLSFTNVSSETIKLDRWPPEIQVKPRHQDEVVFSVAAGTQPLEIKPGDTITMDFTWDQKDTEGKQVSPGWYNITFRDINVIYETDRRRGINPTATVLIQYPQGTMEKTIELNRSETVNEITVTLERIELTSSGVTIYAFGTLPGYAPPPAASPFNQVFAEYSVDGGVVKQAGSAGMQELENGTRFIWQGWGGLDPIPSDAQVLIFRISTITTLRFAPGKPDELVVGPWEFKIPLEPPTPAPEPTTAPSPTPISPYHTTPRGPPEYGLGGVSNRSIYSLGEPVIFKVFIQNMRSTPMVLSPIPPKMEIRLRKSPEEEVEIVETIAPGTGEVKLEPGEKWPYTLVWDQRDSNGQQLAPGYYTPNIWVKDIKIDGKAGDYFGVALSVLIQPPPEPGVKILDINQSQTVNGINFILERIELTSGKMKVYTSVRPVGPVNIFVVSAEAEYSFDAGPVKSAGKSETGILRHMLHIWDNLDPISPDAKELNFVITRFHDVEGSWEFRVPLE